MAGSIDVRPVEADEIEEFLDWFERYWAELEAFNDFRDPFSRDEYRRLLTEPENHHFWWADRDDVHAGFCVFTVGHHWYRHDVTDGYIDEFYVEPAARRRGSGRELALAILAECRRRGVREVRLSALVHNSRAIAFWQNLGFAPAQVNMALPLQPAAPDASGA